MTETGAGIPGEMLTREELSSLLKVPVKTLRNWSTNWNANRKGPRPIKLGPSKQAHVRYSLKDVNAWLEQCASGDFDTHSQVKAEQARQLARRGRIR